MNTIKIIQPKCTHTFIYAHRSNCSHTTIICIPNANLQNATFLIL